MKYSFLWVLMIFRAVAFAAETDSLLGLVFPLEKRGDQVIVQHAVLLNEQCLVQAGAWARIMFIYPKAEDTDVKKIRKKAEDNPAFVRKPYNPESTPNDNLTPEQRATLDRALASTWTEEVSFRAALERWNLDEARFVFQQPNSTEIQSERIDLPEGMLLAEINGKVIVLYVQKDSIAERSGMMPQTILLAFNEKPFSTLAQFQSLYLDQKQKTRTLSLLVQLPSGKQQTIPITLPRSINTDFWSEVDSSSLKKR
ncbi:MAG: hypothetical protein ACOY3I_02660 [Verrucomicrobiota bacterium]